MCEGRITGILTPAENMQEKIMQYAPSREGVASEIKERSL
jgi:hypothetical protein